MCIRDRLVGEQGIDHAGPQALHRLARALRVFRDEMIDEEPVSYTHLTLPPLRERREDIPLLVDHFVAKHAQRTGKPMEGLGPGVIDPLLAYEWPGNVRELENTIERAVVLSTGPRLGPGDVSMLGASSAPADLPSLRLRDNVDWVERETVRRALRAAGDVKKDAAELLGLSQRALSYYLAKFKIE